MEHLRHVERHAATFVSSRGYRSRWFPDETSMISRDDPGHSHQRKLVSDLFTPRASGGWPTTSAASSTPPSLPWP